MEKGQNKYTLIYKISLFVILMLSFRNEIYSQELDTLSLKYPHINYTTKDGLPSNETFCVFQDSRGYIWIGTDRGLVKYDGYEFKTYTTLDGLTDNVVLAVNEDDKGNIWYSCLNNVQLGYIDPQMQFHKYKHYEVVKREIIEVLRMSTLHFDNIYIEGEDIYLTNNRFGYMIINETGIKSKDIRTRKDKFYPDFTEMKLYNDKVKFIYSYHITGGRSYNPMHVYNLNNEVVYTYNIELVADIYPTMVIDKDSVLNIYNGRDYLRIKESEVKHSKVSSNCSVFELDKGQYLFSTYEGDNSDAVIYISNSPNLNKQKSRLIKGVRSVSAIKDLNGGIWISTLNKGIIYFPKLSSKYVNFKNSVTSILPKRDRIIIQTKNKQYVSQNNSEIIKLVSRELMYSDVLENTKKISFFEGLPINLKAKRQGATSDLVGIRGIQTMSDSLMYLWTLGKNFKIRNDTILVDLFWKNYNIALSVQESMYCFKEDSCLYGTRDGFYIYTRDTIYSLNKESNKRIRHIDYFKQTNVLIYSIWGEGLTLEYNTGNTTKISNKNGLVSNTINAVFMDEYERLWIGTNKGVNILTIDSLTGNYNIETISDGGKSLSSPNVLQIYYKDSVLYLGTDAGFDVVDLKIKQERYQHEIPLVLDSLQINDQRRLLTNASMVLSYDSNNLIFYYTAIGFNMLGSINYRYKLDGLSNQWIYTTDRKATFINVRSGKYNFILQVKNEYGTWIELKNKVQFKINKPYWETWWFRLIILGILGYIIYYYVSNLRKEKLFVEQEKRLLEELNESQQKALSSQLNPHFVFNSLNSIQNFILTKRTELSSDYLSMFSKLMRFVFENSKKLYVPLFDEIEALRLYLELEQVRHNHKFKYQIDYQSINTQEFVIPALLIQPIIENAIWHGLLHKLEDDRLLEIRFHSNDTHLQIEVKDNGVGRGATASKPRPKFIKKQRSSGVELTKQRLDLLSQSTGLETNFEIIDLFDENKTPKGTLVKIIIPVNL